MFQNAHSPRSSSHIFYTLMWVRWMQHYVESVEIRSYFWLIFSCTRSEYRKIRTRNNSVFGHFPRSSKFASYHEPNCNSSAIAAEAFCFSFLLWKKVQPYYVAQDIPENKQPTSSCGKFAILQMEVIWTLSRMLVLINH